MRISAHNLNIETGRFYNLDRHERVCSMCNLNVVEDEYHFILQCEKYIDVRRRYLTKYYWQMPSCFKLVQLLSVRNIKELNNLGKYFVTSWKNSQRLFSFHFVLLFYIYSIMLRCYYHNCICIFTDVLNNCILYVYFYEQYCFWIKIIYLFIYTTLYHDDWF